MKDGCPGVTHRTNFKSAPAIRGRFLHQGPGIRGQPSSSLTRTLLLRNVFGWVSGAAPILLTLALVLGPEGALPARAAETDVDTLLESARRAWSAGDLDRALAHMTEAQSRAAGAEKDRVETELGSLYSARGRPGMARSFLRRVVDRSAYVPAMVALARTFLEHPPFEPKRALPLLNRALEKSPRDVEVHLLLARSHHLDKNDDKAIEVYELIKDELDPSELRAFYGLAEVFVSQGKFFEAKPILREALTVDPGNAETMYRFGNMMMGATGEPGHLVRAIGWYRQAVTQQPDHPRYRAALIYALFRNGNNLEATPHIEALHRTGPNRSETFWVDGIMAEYRSHVGQAIEQYRDALARDHGNTFAHYTLGVILAGRQNTDFIKMRARREWKYLPHRNVEEALQHFQTVLALDPSFPFLTRVSTLMEDLYATPTEEERDSPRMQQMRETQTRYYETKSKLF